MRVSFATSFMSRVKGLLMREEFSESHCEPHMLILTPCHDIHTVGMSYPIDVAFVAENGQVILSERNVHPGKRVKRPKAAAVCERRACDGDSWPDVGMHMMVDFR